MPVFLILLLSTTSVCVCICPEAINYIKSRVIEPAQPAEQVYCVMKLSMHGRGLCDEARRDRNDRKSKCQKKCQMSQKCQRPAEKKSCDRKVVSFTERVVLMVLHE